MVMTVENSTELSTCKALMKIRRRRWVQPMAGSVSMPCGPVAMSRSACTRSRGGRWKLRKMFSTRITAESTMMPKSTAPSDSRLADSPVSTSIMMLKNSANGMFMLTITALRTSPRKIHWMKNTSRQPKIRLWITVCVVTFTSVERS